MAILSSSVSSAPFNCVSLSTVDDSHGQGPCLPRPDFHPQMHFFRKACLHHHYHHHQQQQQPRLIPRATIILPSGGGRDPAPMGRERGPAPKIILPSGTDVRDTLANREPVPAGGREVYQPFRPPPPSIPALEGISLDEQLEILRDRRGRWYEYAIHVPSLIRAGYMPSMIDEATGMSGVEQNKIVVASQVRSSLQSSGMDEMMLSEFDIGGADLLYELRILSADQRKSAAEFALERKMGPKDWREMARAIKDYERRKREEGWSSFSFTPGDCLAYACYRLSKEVKSGTERENVLRKGLEYAVSDKARDKLLGMLERGEGDITDDEQQQARVEVIRLSPVEAGSPSIPYVLPVAEPSAEDIEAAPVVTPKGPFTIQHSETAWKSWVGLPPWGPLKNSGAPVAVSYPNAGILPWKPKSKKDLEEPILVIVDKQNKESSDDSYFIVDANGILVLQRGTLAAETGSRILGRVVLLLRPPLPETDELDIEWD